MHALDFKGLAKHVNDTLNPVARKRIRQEKFNKAFQDAFDKEFKTLVPEIELEMELETMPQIYMPVSYMRSPMLIDTIKQYSPEYQHKDDLGKGFAASA